MVKQESCSWLLYMSTKVGASIIAIGGMLLFLALYQILYTVLYQYFNPTGGIFGALFFGFVGFWLIAYGSSLTRKSVSQS